MKIKLFIFLLISIPLLVYGYKRYEVATESAKRHKLVSPLGNPVKFVQAQIDHIFKAPIDPVIEKALAGAKGEYSLVIKNFDTKKSYSYRESVVYSAASLYKLWVMAVVVQQLQAGKLKETDIVSSNVQRLNARLEVASESAEVKEGTISMTVKQALEQMITISHNYAALLLSEKVGAKTIDLFLKENELKNSSFGSPPKTTAKDIALFYEKLQNGEFANQEYTQKMIALLSRQQLNDRIPKLLPKKITVAHKTGELEGYKHDAGIVYSEKDDYIFVALSKSEYPPGAAERIAQISQAVYNYYLE